MVTPLRAPRPTLHELLDGNNLRDFEERLLSTGYDNIDDLLHDLITNAEELKTELVTDVGMQKPKARRLLRALRAVVEGLKGTPAPQSTTHRLQVPLAGEMKENLPVALEAVLITQELQSAPNFVEMEKIIRDQLERDHNGQMIQALAEQEAALEAAHKAHILAIRNEMALALPKVSTPVLNPDGNFRLATVTSKPKHMVKTWTIQNWSTVVRVPGRILYDREFFFADHRWRWRLYPGGVSDDVGNNVSLYLDCRDATEKHKACECHTFRIVNHMDPTKHYEQKSLPYKTHTDPDGWGWGKFIPHKDLDDKKCGYKTGESDDTIVLELDLTVYDQAAGQHETTDAEK
jgi:hypothetical protein